MKTPKAHAETKRRPDFARYCRLVNLYVACIRNARSHLDAAQTLCDAGYASQAFALAFTGWEEVGKAQIVADFANGMAAEAEYEDAFRKHHLKVSYNSRHFELNATDPRASVIKYDAASPKPLFEARQGALYVGRDENDGAILTGIPLSAAREGIRCLWKLLDDIDAQDAISERIGTASFLK